MSPATKNEFETHAIRASTLWAPSSFEWSVKARQAAQFWEANARWSKLLFDVDWRFHRGGWADAHRPGLNDTKWHWEDMVSDCSGYEGKPFDVIVYSSCGQVEILLDGKSLGTITTDRSTEYMAAFQISYQPGAMKAVGYGDDKPVKSTGLQTTQKRAQTRLPSGPSSVRDDGKDHITVEITGKNGVRDPTTENVSYFQITGSGTISGGGNANPVSTESDQLPRRKAWKERRLILIKSRREPGKITLSVAPKGLPSSSINIESHSQATSIPPL